MQAVNAPCPPESVLTDFGSGKLDPASAATVGQHLATCEGCRAVVQRVDKSSAHSPPPIRPHPTLVPGDSLSNFTGRLADAAGRSATTDRAIGG